MMAHALTVDEARCMHTQADPDTPLRAPSQAAPGTTMPYVSEKDTMKTLSLRTTAISLSDVLDYAAPPRKTKIVCTLGPSSWTEEGLSKLLDAGG